MPNKSKILKFIASVAICELAGVVGSLFTTPKINSWYAFLNKPAFTPSGFFIGLVWVILFFLMGISLYLVWSKNWQGTGKFFGENRKYRLAGTATEAKIIFGIQLALNILWSIVFFGLQSPLGAFFVLLMLWVSIVATMAYFAWFSRQSAWLLLPYILWVSFAGVLNYMIIVLNS